MNLPDIFPPEYSGAVSIRQAGRVLHEQAYGYADLPNKRPNRLDTRFVTASAGKAFTAAGILRLIEQDKLSLDSKLGTLVDFDLEQIDPQITVRQLLTHTSGIPDYCDEELVPNYADLFIDFPNYRVRTSRDIMPLFIHMPMTDPPGTRFCYNNTGFVMLGLIIEAITGLSFDAYLVEAVFAPCGMQDTGYFEYDRLPANCASAYIWDDARKEYYTNIYSTTAKGLGDGGAFTTAADVERFWRGLYAGKIISASLVEQMTSPQVAPNCYGLGLWMEKLDGRYMPHFEGSEPGISFWSAFDAQRDLIITLISNRGDRIWGMHREILRQFYQDVPPKFYYGG